MARSWPRWSAATAGFAPADRLAVYANAYFARIHDCLRDDFGALARALGPAAFHDLVKTYLMMHAPTRPSLRHAGAHLAEHLSTEPFAGDLLAPLPVLRRPRPARVGDDGGVLRGGRARPRARGPRCGGARGLGRPPLRADALAAAPRLCVAGPWRARALRPRGRRHGVGRGTAARERSDAHSCLEARRTRSLPSHPSARARGARRRDGGRVLRCDLRSHGGGRRRGGGGPRRPPAFSRRGSRMGSWRACSEAAPSRYAPSPRDVARRDRFPRRWKTHATKSPTVTPTDKGTSAWAISQCQGLGDGQLRWTRSAPSDVAPMARPTPARAGAPRRAAQREPHGEQSRRDREEQRQPDAIHTLRESACVGDGARKNESAGDHDRDAQRDAARRREREALPPRDAAREGQREPCKADQRQHPDEGRRGPAAPEHRQRVHAHPARDEGRRRRPDPGDGQHLAVQGGHGAHGIEVFRQPGDELLRGSSPAHASSSARSTLRSAREPRWARTFSAARVTPARAAACATESCST